MGLSGGAGEGMGSVGDATREAGAPFVPLSPMRRAVALQVARSAANIPHIHLGHVAVVDELVRTVEARQGQISLTALLVRAAGQALVRHPLLTTRYSDEGLRPDPELRVGLLVATGDGLLIPSLTGVHQMGAEALTARLADLVQRARARKLLGSETVPAPFNLSNLGMYGIRWFTALVPPGQTAILSVGAVYEAPVVRKGRLEAAHLLELVLSVDHRVVDGAEAATFLQELVASLEQPDGLAA